MTVIVRAACMPACLRRALHGPAAETGRILVQGGHPDLCMGVYELEC